jgi:succinyl-diaminopimelate desuccinylase
LGVPASLRSCVPRVFDIIDQSFDEEIKFLQHLVQFPTVNPPGRYREIAGFLDSFARSQGLKAETFTTPIDVCKSARIASDEPRLSVKFTVGRRGVKPRVLLLAHLDTVPVGGVSSWKHDPFKGEVDDGKIHGRGACDCKGRIAAYVYATLALKKALQDPPSEVTVAATADEEIGGETGAKYLLKNSWLDCDYCIGEGYTREVFNGFKGLLWLRISIAGKSAHGAAPHLGESAVEPFADLFRDLNEYQEKLRSLDERADTTMNVGIVNAGSKINMVPDSASVEIDFRVGRSYKVDRVVSDVSSILGQLKQSHNGRSFNLEVLARSEPIELDAEHALVKNVHSAVEEVTKSKIPVKLWFAHSDTMHFLRSGIPAVNYGVGSPGVPHTADEWVSLEDLRLSTKALALSLIKIMGGSGHAHR